MAPACVAGAIAHQDEGVIANEQKQAYRSPLRWRLLAASGCSQQGRLTKLPPRARQRSRRPATRPLPPGSTRTAGSLAAKAAGLDATLAGPGPYTVFVPDDAAFDKLPAGTFDSWTKPEARAELTRVLTYHILPGTVLADDIGKAIDNGKGKAVLATMGGENADRDARGWRQDRPDRCRRKQGDDGQGRRDARQRRGPSRPMRC